MKGGETILENVSGIVEKNKSAPSLLDQLLAVLEMVPETNEMKSQFEQLLTSFETKSEEKLIISDVQLDETIDVLLQFRPQDTLNKDEAVQLPAEKEFIDQLENILIGFTLVTKPNLEEPKTYLVELDKVLTTPTNYLDKLSNLQDVKMLQTLRQTLKELVQTATKGEGQTQLSVNEPSFVMATNQVAVPATLNVEVHESELGKQITKTVQEFAGNVKIDSKQIDIIINPRHLGEVKMELVKTEQGVEVKVSVTNGEIKDRVEHMLGEAKKELSDRGIELQYNVHEDRGSEEQKRKEQPEPEQKPIEEESMDEISFSDLFEKEIGG